MTPAATAAQRVQHALRDTLALVLAGGKGSRLKQLTQHRAKPAVFFGGKFRVIDFALSNCVNSGIRRIAVITQYKSHSLIRHLQRGWGFLRGEFDEMLEILPASQRLDDDTWYRGTADAVLQNLDIIKSKKPRHVLILAGDHVYKMDYGALLSDHLASGRRCTVACIEVPRTEASAFGVMKVDALNHAIAFVEKAADPPPLPDRPDTCLASMGIYVFDTDYLQHLLESLPPGNHDFGYHVIPAAVDEGEVHAHPFALSCVSTGNAVTRYWRDVGTLDSYHQANLDLAQTLPDLDIYDTRWPIWTHQLQLPPAKFVPDHSGAQASMRNTLVSAGCVVSGGELSESVLFPNVRVESFARIERSVLMPGVIVRQRCQLRNAVVDCGCELPEGLVVGVDPAVDSRRFERTEQGVVLITREMLGSC